MPYFSMYTEDELRGLDRDEVMNLIGLMHEGTIIVPAPCSECGAHTVKVYLKEEYLQCVECGTTKKSNHYKHLRF